MNAFCVGKVKQAKMAVDTNLSEHVLQAQVLSVC